ncbi:septal ring lytic transglycosylase RlpA family protein [Solitalea koreensis]|uniref:Probable endolytic peptidoglycan transglycosylase RlpA n=1 Tax=Solitalea koreensis TaxID=543615 RepID=A0A521C4A4_9SPHI|nr:septal ring lytic transglycosylase RlpA family protein [Solitalea koreensis]SMO54229.1 rare lipoprotein A [Solitalea koreensis]
MKPKTLIGLLASGLGFTACSTVSQTGKASYYSNEFEGQKTASGDRYESSELTAAHRTLPFGTILHIKNLENGKTVKVIVNDRGPYVAGRVIDLSKKAAYQLGMVNSGVARVKVSYKKPIQK